MTEKRATMVMVALTEEPTNLGLEHSVKVFFSAEDAPRGAIVKAAESVAGTKSVNVSVEIPDFLPADIDAWLEANSHATVEDESGARWSGETRRVVEPPIAYPSRQQMLGAYAALGRALGGARLWKWREDGQYLGARDRCLIQLLFTRLGGIGFKLGVMEYACRGDVRYERDPRHEILGLRRSPTYRSESDSDEDYQRDLKLARFEREQRRSERKDLGDATTPCSGIWKDAGELFEEGYGTSALNVLVKEMEAFEIVEAQSPWDEFQGTFSLMDVAACDVVAVEAFLYARRLYIDANPNALEAHVFDRRANRVVEKEERKEGATATDSGGEEEGEEEGTGTIVDDPTATKTPGLRDKFASAADAYEVARGLAIDELMAKIEDEKRRPHSAVEDRQRYVDEFLGKLRRYELKLKLGELYTCRLRVATNGSIQVGDRGFMKVARQLEVCRAEDEQVSPDATHTHTGGYRRDLNTGS